MWVLDVYVETQSRWDAITKPTCFNCSMVSKKLSCQRALADLTKLSLALDSSLMVCLPVSLQKVNCNTSFIISFFYYVKTCKEQEIEKTRKPQPKKNLNTQL